jgi:hypothetical protein
LFPPVIRIIRVVRRHAVAFKVDAQKGVGVNRIAGQAIARVLLHEDAVAGVEGDEVCLALASAADSVVRAGDVDTGE